MIEVRLGAAAAGDELVEGSTDELRTTAGTLARAATAGRTEVSRPGLGGAGLTAFTEGLALGGYQFSLASTPSPRRRIELRAADDRAAFERGLANASATAWARDLANTPAATKTPEWLAREAARVLRPAGVDVQIRDEAWLAEQGFGGVLAVGSGSAAPPRLIHASWRPRSAPADTHVVLVGKGITFDTGGLNVKTGDGMRTMKTDMSGGAAVLAALRLIATLQLPVRVSVLVPCAENSFGGASFRPGDVVRHVGGRTSEITNTDAEGRLVLADALAYAAARLKPTVLVDLATLTGAMKVALGLRTAGFFATTDALAGQLTAAAAASGEPLWRMPLAADYEGSLGSAIADADNAPGSPGAITAALFLQHFTGGLPWAHLDIAGPARAPKDDGIFAQGATGFGTRLLASWVEDLAAHR
ncbi:leucyl aminopeptidase family protein [Jatrophihabitans sp.]|uniref:leucyl aminopeptidase family protein n=1 Tax=Jatrophihabitans sp. TaxID=1932789 RepID=UPI0030C6AD18|nr:leucyl aminopeptidase [Jatrophihabitans sp.]